MYTKLAENLTDVHLSKDKRKQLSLLMEGLRSKKGIQRQTVTIILDIITLVGCEYLFLFAADLTEDELLVRYYNDYLGFTEKTEHHVAMPLYDLACKFMYQDTKDLMNRRNVFFDNFNPDEDAV